MENLRVNSERHMTKSLHYKTGNTETKNQNHESQLQKAHIS